MPRTTHGYGFEAKVLEYASGLSARFTTGAAMRSFLLEVGRDGSVTSLSFGDNSREWTELALAAQRTGTAHLFYDPLNDGMEYVWLSWQGVKQQMMERLIGQQFDEADFLPIPAFARRVRVLNPEAQFPLTWGVMF
jgi:hypothetical protein